MGVAFSQLLPSEPKTVTAHVASFEDWFVAYQKEHGMEGSKLDNIEHAIIRSYIYWLRNHAADPSR